MENGEIENRKMEMYDVSGISVIILISDISVIELISDVSEISLIKLISYKLNIKQNENSRIRGKFKKKII